MVRNPVIFGPGGYIHTVSNSTQLTTETFPPFSYQTLMSLIPTKSNPTVVASASILTIIQILLHDLNGPNPNSLANAKAVQKRRSGNWSMRAVREESRKLPSVFSFLLFSVLQSLRFMLTCYFPHIIQIRRYQHNQCDNRSATGLYQPLPAATRNDRLYRIMTYLLPWGHVILPL